MVLEIKKKIQININNERAKHIHAHKIYIKA